MVHTNRNVSNFSTFLVTLMMLLGSIVATNLSDNVAASVSGDLSIDESSPSEDDYIPAYDATYFEVTVTNLDQLSSQVRTINWYVCVGEQLSNSCKSSSIDNGEIVISNLLPGETFIFSSDDPFYPNGLNETITVVYQFDEFDFNPSNDLFTFFLNASLQYTDIIVEENENIVNQLSGLATYDGDKILANNTDYQFTFSGFANICGSCQINTTLGWELWNENKSELITQHFVFEQNYPKLSFYKSFTMNLPLFNHSEDGTYTLIYGIFNSTGDPFSDMHDSNNLNEIQIIINTELDLTIDSLYPSHNPSSVSYLYGQDMITASISNNGNMTAVNFDLTLQLLAPGSNLISQTCTISIIRPNEQKTCLFDMSIEGEAVQINAILQDTVLNNQDSNTLDNTLNEISSVIVPQLMSSIEVDNPKDWYTDNELITYTANVNPYSASPVNFSWWYSGIINIDYGNSITIDTASYGLGSHNFKLVATDYLGNSETTYFSILVYDEIQISNIPLYQASAITAESTVEIVHQTLLPTIRENYNLGEDKDPILLLDFNLAQIESSQTAFDGQNWVDVELDLFHTVPENTSISSVEIKKLNSISDTSWENFNTENLEFVNQTIVKIRLYEATTILVTADLGEPNIESLNFSVDLISGGNFELSWENYGDTESDYILGWNIHQKIVPEFGGTIFQSPQQVYNENLWEDLVADSFRAFIPLGENSWQDLVPVPDGFCASYAIIPVDRTGNTYNHLANVSMENGTAAFVCGDSTPPSTSIINMQNSWRFTNDTACYDILKDWNLCYEVTISWVWPEGEVDETWNLYRVEQNPNGMDLALLQPILSGISYVAGESFQFTQNGIDDDTIRPMKTYYYILTPTDQYGNERTVAIYPSANVERVHIENDWWAYNQHVIPEPEPEPEPPLNSEWLGNFSDSLDQQEFQTAGIVTLVTLCLGVIMLAFISKRLKRLKRVIGARNRRLAANSMADEFDEFFE